MKELLLVLHENNKEALGSVRYLQHLQVAVADGWVWLKCPHIEGTSVLILQQLPAQFSYHLGEDNKLFPPGGRTPVKVLPEMNWLPIQQFIPLELPVAAMPGKPNKKCAVQLVGSERQEEGRAMLINLKQWKAYAASAPDIRLKALRFAVSENSKVLIMGTPLPPLPGQEYWIQEGCLIPAGLDFKFSIVASLLAARFNPQREKLLLFHADGSWESIPSHALVPATRSGVRLSREGLSYE